MPIQIEVGNVNVTIIIIWRWIY